MDPNSLLVWVVGLNAALALARLARPLRHRPETVRGWAAVYGVLLAGLLLLLATVPERAGLVVGPFWALFALVPALGSGAIVRLLHRGRFGAAAALARAVALLHPLDGWTEYPDFVDLYRALHAGDSARVRAITDRLRGVATPFEHAAELMSAGATGDWEGYRRFIESRPDRDAVLRDPNALNGYLSALGRLGEHEAMVRAYARHAPALIDGGGRTVSTVARLGLAAQTGSLELLEHLLSALGSVPRAVADFYRAVGEQVAGRTAEAEARFRAVLDDPTAGATLQARSRRHLDEPLPVFRRESLSDEARAVLAEVERDVLHESRYAVASGPRRRPLATWAVAAVLLAVFALELRGGSTDTANLVDMGAVVVPTELAPARWWRPIAAGFLHYGPTHLALNGLGLLVLGGWLERAVGARRLLVVYALSLVASTGLFPLFVGFVGTGEPRVLVGASGGVLGLLGALLARTLVGRLRGRSRVVGRQLSVLVLMVALQAAFDRSVPEVSSICHAIGFTTGFAVGLALALAERRD